MRKSNNSRRSNWAQAIRKQQIRLPSLKSIQGNTADDGSSSAFTKREEKVQRVAKLSWKICCAVCSIFCLTPITVDGVQFRANTSPPWKRAVFYVVAALVVLIVGGHKYIIFARRLFSGMPLDGVTCFCFLPFVIYSAYTIFVIGVIFQEHETQEIINGLGTILSYVSPDDGPTLSPFEDVRSCMAAIQIFGALIGSSLGYTVTCVAMPDLPFLVAPTLAELGWINWSSLSPTVWGLLFSPIETILYAIPLFFLTFVCQMLVLEVGAAKIYVAEIRKETTDITSHVRQLKLYNRLLVSMKIVTMWLKPAIVPLFFCIGSGVVFLLYLVLRSDDTLPKANAFIMGYTAFVILVALFFVSYDVVSVIQGSEDIVKNLQSRQHEYYNMIGPDMKTELLKTARALKRLEIPVGNFATFGFGVTEVIYEEILNQLLFLLTL